MTQEPTPTATELQFVEEMGLALADSQTPLMLGRVLGWLLLSIPNPQSAEDLASALQASRGAISMATRTLMNVGLISRRSFSGDRRTYYEMRPETLARTLAARFSTITKMRGAIENGIERLGDKPAERHETLEYLHEMYRYFETEFQRIFETWDARSGAKPGSGKMNKQ